MNHPSNATDHVLNICDQGYNVVENAIPDTLRKELRAAGGQREYLS